MGKFRFIPFLLVFATASAFGATFVVPPDAAMVGRSHAVVTADVLNTYSRIASDGSIETITTVAIAETIKGAFAEGSTLEIVEPGGHVGDLARVIPGVPQFQKGERVLLFLRQWHGRWSATDFVLGAFKFATDTNGEQLLLRDQEEIFGWDLDGRPHREPRRNATRFLEYLRDVARGKAAASDYIVQSSTATVISAVTIAPTATFPASSFMMDCGGGNGCRWNVFPSTVSWYNQNTEAGAPNGGITAFQQGLAMWTNDCASNVQYSYVGTNTNATGGLDRADGVNAIKFDVDLSAHGAPPYSCASGGTIALGGITNASGSHTAVGETFYTTQEGDVVGNVGLANCTSFLSSGDFVTALTHEVGHTLGFRHSNEGRAGGPCPSTIECSSSAVMNSIIVRGLNGALQPWDVDAVRTVYPGGTCTTCTPPSITGQPASQTITSGQSVTLSVTATGTAPLSYQWYVGVAGNTATPIGANSNQLVVAPTASSSYWVLVGNPCGSASSSTATITVNVPVTTGVRSDFNGDSYPDLLWRNYSTGANVIWFMQGATRLSAVSIDALADTQWVIEGVGDMDGDGKPDIIWRNHSTGENVVWLMNGTTRTSGLYLDAVTDLNWDLEAVGDLNGDGSRDLVWRNTATGQNVVWFMSGLTRTSAVFLPTVATNWRLETAGDINHDGKDDLVWRDYNTGQNVVWFMNGATMTSSAFLDTVGDTSWHIKEALDLNRDGQVDLVWRNATTGQNVVWFMSGTTRTSAVFLPDVTDTAWSIEDRQ